VVITHVAAIRLYEHEGWIHVRQVNTELRSGDEIEEFVFCAPLASGVI
jgi:hypothetical protein